MLTTDHLPLARTPRPAPAAAPRALLVEAARDAVLAPSSHNSQPWRFALRHGASADASPMLELRADRTRSLPVVDPDDRALLMSCGAALGFLRVSLRAAGYDAIVRRLPVAADRDMLATVQVGAPCEPTDADRARAEAMARRHTNRRAFAPRAIPAGTIDALRATVAEAGVSLRIVTDAPMKEAIADLVAAGDRRQASDPAFRRELAAWIRPNRTSARDGMPGAAHGAGDLASLLGPWIIRTFDWGDGQAAKDRRLCAESPALALLATERDTPDAWLRAGEALGLMLLDATRAGLAASFLNQPIEVPGLRVALAHTLGLEGCPQLLLRLGYGPAVPPTPRRSLGDVLDDR